MNAERLLQLATFLETDPRVKDHFDLEVIASGTFGDFGVQAIGAQCVSIEAYKAVPPCGAMACAIGWMPFAFPFSGLKYASHGISSETESCPWASAEEFLDIDSDDSGDLFDPDCYLREDFNSPQVVAKRIRDFVAFRS